MVYGLIFQSRLPRKAGHDSGHFFNQCGYTYCMDKKVILLVSGVGGVVGGYIPTLLGASGFSGWSILGAFVGGIFGIWVGVQLSDY